MKDAALEIARQATSQKFHEVMDRTIGPSNSWDHIAAVFYLTKKAITLAGAGGAVALQVKDLAVEYVADKFATWIVDQGGWVRIPDENCLLLIVSLLSMFDSLCRVHVFWNLKLPSK